MHPDIFQVGKDDSIKGAIKAAIRDPVLAILQAGEEREFPIFDHRDQPENAPSKQIRMSVSWRRSDSTWMWQIPRLILDVNWRSATNGRIFRIGVWRRARVDEAF